MARLPRLVLAGLPHHVVLRGNHGGAVFIDEADHLSYLDALRDAARTHGVRVHAYVLLPGEVQLLVTPERAEGLGRMMQSLGRRYGAWFNRRHQRAGSLWEGRFRAAVIEPQAYFIDVCLYIEEAPVRGGLCAKSQDWRWSSHAFHVGHGRDALLADHAQYWAMGNTPFDREMAYRLLGERGLGSSTLRQIEAAASRGWALGGADFLAALAVKTPRPLQPRPRGRPRKAPGPVPSTD